MGILDAPALSPRKYKKFRLRDTLGRSTGELPTVMASPPTVTSRALNSATTTGSPITNAALVWADSPVFSFRGGKPSFTQFGGSIPALISSTYTSGNTTQSAMLVACSVYSVGGTMELWLKNGSDTGVRVKLDGKYVTWPNVTCQNSTNDGSATAYAFSIGTGWHHLEIEMGSGSTLIGLFVGPTDTVRPAHFEPRQKWAWAGASFEEPTVVDSSTTSMNSWGYPMYVGHMLGVDVVTCAKGGTGYLNPGPGLKMHDRLSDLIGLNPDVIVWGGSLAMNDNGYGTTAAQAAQVAACFDDVAAALPNAFQIVCGPTWTRGHLTMPGTIFQVRDTVKAAADARSFPYIEMLAPVTPSSSLTPAATTLTAAASAGDSTITVAASQILPPSDFQVYGQTVIQIGTGATTELRAIQSYSGTAPQTLGVNEAGNPLSYAHTVGEPVKVVAHGFNTGSGTQTNPSGSGNCDVFVGSDSTHPTMLGHLNLANYIYGRLALLLDA